VRATIVAAILAALSVFGCTTLFDKPVAPEAKVCVSLPSPARLSCAKAGDMLAKGYIMLAAVNTTIIDNVKSEVWTTEQGREYLIKSVDAREKLDRAYDVFMKGDFASAMDQATIINAVIVALQKEIAAQARKTS
jgi:hypothetical protein